MKTKTCIVVLLALALSDIGCREDYIPPVTTTDYQYLVVEGFANSGQDSTSIRLSRTRRLADTISFLPELHAVIFVQGESGSSYPIAEQGQGLYRSGPLPLQNNQRYRLKITTSDGKIYSSAYVPITSTPPIDSLTWSRNNDISIRLNTHDPLNATHFYRWDYSETWEYHSFYEGGLVYKNGQVDYADSSETTFACWSSSQSTRIILGTSENLSEDRVSNQEITSIPNGSGKLNYKYSILVRQYGLTREAFTYWQLLQRSSEQTGTLFDSQPSELIGNLHCESDPGEPVIGYFSVSAIQELRLYIKRSQVTGWPEPDETVTCTPKIFPADSASYYLADTSYLPAYFVSGGGLAIAKRKCVDCRLRGGTTEKPAFWQ